MARSIHTGMTVAVMLAAASGPALSDPWTLPAGRADITTTYTYSDAVDALDNDGERDLSADFYMHTIETLIQLGATEYLTAFARPTFRRVEVGGTEEAGHSQTDVGLRLRLIGGESEVFSVQAHARLPGDIDGFRNVRLNQGETEYEVRALYGARFDLSGIPGFFTAEGGYRFRNGGPADEIFADFGFGWQPQRATEVLVESINVWGEGQGDDPLFYPYFRQHQVRASLVAYPSETFSLQLGGFVTWDGQNVVAEDGGFVSGKVSF